MVGKIRQFFIKKRIQRRSGAVLYPSARIVNNNGAKNAIQIGAFSHVKGELLTFGHGGEIQIGRYCYIGEQTKIWSAKSIKISDRVLISHNVNIFDNSTHPLNADLRHQQFKAIITTGHPKNLNLDERPVLIKDDALICCMVVILAGVTIGKGAIVGAGSVVTKDVPPWTLVAGNPARIIRELSEDER